MTSVLVVAATGAPRSGKDTLGEHLARLDGFTVLAFADPVYTEVAQAFDVSEEQLRSNEWKTSQQKQLQSRFCSDHGFRKTLKHMGFFNDDYLSSRQVLQAWGTEYRRREFGQDYWAQKLRPKLQSSDLIYVSDMREYVELAMMLRAVARDEIKNLYTVEISRVTARRTEHSSDHGISHYFLDFLVENNTEPLDMYHAVKANLIERGLIQ